MTSPADKDALVKRLQFTIDDGTLRERDGGCRTATDHEIALWNILTAPAEAAVAFKPWADDIALYGPEAPKNNGRVSHLIQYLLTVHKRYGDTQVTSNIQWGAAACWKRDEQAQRIADLEKLISAPLPQAVLVSREAVIEECAKVCESAEGYSGGPYFPDLMKAARLIRGLAAHPAEPAGKGE